MSDMQNRIQEWRKERRLTLDELARLVGTSPQQIHRLEQSTRQLSDKWLSLLSVALNVPKASLLIDDLVAPGFTLHQGDFVKNDTERRLLLFWRSLPTEARDFVLGIVDNWAERFGCSDK